MSVLFLQVFFSILAILAPVLVPMVAFIAVLGLWVGRKEGWPRSQALYFACITATTVGYGDLHPSRPGTRTAAILIALTGILMTGILVAGGLHALQVCFERMPPTSN